MSRRAEGPASGRFSLMMLAGAVCLGVLLPQPVSGRQDAEYSRAVARERAQARFDSLLPLLDRAGDRASAVETAKQEALLRRPLAGTDTINVGPLRVIVIEGKGDRARAYFANALQSYALMLGGEVPETLQRQLFAFQSGFVVKEMQLPPGVIPVFARPWTRPSAVEGLVRNVVGRVLVNALPHPQTRWVSPALITPYPNLERDYRELASGASPTLDRCRGGDLEACWVGMGETGLADPSQELRLWYTEEQRRGVVRSSTRFRLHPAAADCLEGEIQHCDALLAQWGDEWAPLGPNTRAALVSVAIELGGEGAFHRFAQPPPQPPAQLDFRDVIASTAGTDADRVMAEWHRRVIAARPDRPGTDRQARVATGFWILLFLALSARSTRWRLG